MRLLLIEDDQQVSWILKHGLQQHYTIDVANTGKDGLFRGMTFGYDAIVLDLNLPDVDGADVCRRLRENSQPTPILVLTGKVDLASTVELLNAGADDYLTKPFRLEEVLARLRAITRRMQANASVNILTAGDLELDTVRHVVRRAGKTVNLRRKEFELLEYFMYNQSQTLTRSMIIEHVWDAGEELWGNVVDVHVKHLRDKIDRPFTEQLIKTVRGVGYKLEAKAERALVKT